MYTDKLSTILGHGVTIEPPPLTLRYAPARVRMEALKAALGASLCFAAIVLLSPASVIAWPMAGVGVLFLLYLAQQWRRRALRLELTTEGLARTAVVPWGGGWGGSGRLSWSGLEALRLHFFPHRRRSLQGTLVLTLQGSGARLKLDSSLEHFPTLLQHAAAAARERALQLDATSAANLAQLGL